MFVQFVIESTDTLVPQFLGIFGIITAIAVALVIYAKQKYHRMYIEIKKAHGDFARLMGKQIGLLIDKNNNFLKELLPGGSIRAIIVSEYSSIKNGMESPAKNGNTAFSTVIERFEETLPMDSTRFIINFHDVPPLLLDYMPVTVCLVENFIANYQKELDGIVNKYAQKTDRVYNINAPMFVHFQSPSHPLEKDITKLKILLTKYYLYAHLGIQLREHILVILSTLNNYYSIVKRNAKQERKNKPLIREWDSEETFRKAFGIYYDIYIKKESAGKSSDECFKEYASLESYIRNIPWMKINGA